MSAPEALLRTKHFAVRSTTRAASWGPEPALAAPFELITKVTDAMKITTKLLFGIRTSQTVSLVVTADGVLPAQPPDLQITTTGRESAIPCSGNAWTVALGSGDHTVRLTAAGDRWFEGAVTFTLSAPATIVSRVSSTSPLVTFTTTTGVASPAEDPKNPWPPPRKAASAPLVEPTWVGTTLTTLSEQVSTDRSASASESPAAAPPPARWR